MCLGGRSLGGDCRVEVLRSSWLQTVQWLMGIVYVYGEILGEGAWVQNGDTLRGVRGDGAVLGHVL